MVALTEAELVGKYVIDQNGDLDETSPYDVLTWAHQAIENAERSNRNSTSPTVLEVINAWYAEKKHYTDEVQAAIEFTHKRMAPYLR